MLLTSVMMSLVIRSKENVQVSQIFKTASLGLESRTLRRGVSIRHKRIVTYF